MKMLETVSKRVVCTDSFLRRANNGWGMNQNQEVSILTIYPVQFVPSSKIDPSATLKKWPRVNFLFSPS